VSGRSCEIASRRRRSIDRRKAGTAIHCGIGPDNAQKRIKYGNSRRKATSRTFRSLFRTFEASSDFSKLLQTFPKPLQTFRSLFRFSSVSSGLYKYLQNLPLHSAGLARPFSHQPRTTSSRDHRGPRWPRKGRAPTQEELRQATIPPANNSYGASRVHFSRAHWTNRRRSKFPSEERPILHCTGPCEESEPGKPPLYSWLQKKTGSVRIKLTHFYNFFIV
jgi:hypothetical protein